MTKSRILAISGVTILAAIIGAAGAQMFDRRPPGESVAMCAPGNSPMDRTISAMFERMGTDLPSLETCWTPGLADPALLALLAAAEPPASYTIVGEHSRGRDGVLYASVIVTAAWPGAAPPIWVGPQVAVLRQHRDWSWTIDTILPRTRSARRDHPSCGICH